jgi:superfamily II DNA or RNA helicase
MEVYVSGLVWLPMDQLLPQQIFNIKNQLTVYPKKTTDIGNQPDPPPIFMFVEDFERGLLGVPRGYYLKTASRKHPESLHVSYGTPMQELSTKYSADGPFAEQEDVLRVFETQMEGRKWGGFLLKAGCGFGKTATALELARRVGRRTLILVHQEFFLDQWRDRIMDFMPDARVGVIRQNKCEYEDKDFVIGMIQSLSKDDGKRYPPEMYWAFGTVISDEVHRVGAASWAGIIPRFYAAWRIGLSATPRRKDGAQDVFFNHISEISYSAETEAQVPKLRTLHTHARLRPIARGSYRVDVADLNSAQILTQIGEDSFRAKEVVEQVVLAVKAGRKIMVVSERMAHLKTMSTMLLDALFDMNLPFDPKIDYYTGEWFTGGVWEKTTTAHRKGDPKTEKRSQADLKRAESANVIFATKQMVAEGLDIQALDVLVLATPMSDIEQAVGRVRRWCTPSESKCARLCPWRAGKCEKKPTPIVLDVVDDEIPQLLGKWRRRKAFYSETGITGGVPNDKK